MKKNKAWVILFAVCSLMVAMAAGYSYHSGDVIEKTHSKASESYSEAEDRHNARLRNIEQLPYYKEIPYNESLPTNEVELGAMMMEEFAEGKTSEELVIALSKEYDKKDPNPNGISNEQLAKEFIQYQKNKGYDFNKLAANDWDTVFDEMEQFGKETGYSEQ